MCIRDSSRNANHLEELGRLEIRHMHKQMDATMKDVAEAKEKEEAAAREKNPSKNNSNSSGTSQT